MALTDSSYITRNSILTYCQPIAYIIIKLYYKSIRTIINSENGPFLLQRSLYVLIMEDANDVDNVGYPAASFHAADPYTDSHIYEVSSFYFAFHSHYTGSVPYHQIALFSFHIRCDSTSMKVVPNARTNLPHTRPTPNRRPALRSSISVRIPSRISKNCIGTHRLDTDTVCAHPNEI
jgi:hypothetical protein